jgi:hypothetical protein
MDDNDDLDDLDDLLDDLDEELPLDKLDDPDWKDDEVDCS